MPYELTFSEWGKSPGTREAYFDVRVDGQYYRRIAVLVPWALETMVGTTLGIKGEASSDPEFQ